VKYQQISISKYKLWWYYNEFTILLKKALFRYLRLKLIIATKNHIGYQSYKMYTTHCNKKLN